VQIITKRHLLFFVRFFQHIFNFFFWIFLLFWQFLPSYCRGSIDRIDNYKSDSRTYPNSLAVIFDHSQNQSNQPNQLKLFSAKNEIPQTFPGFFLPAATNPTLSRVIQKYKLLKLFSFSFAMPIP